MSALAALLVPQAGHADVALRPNRLPLAKALDQPVFSLDGSHVELFSLLFLFLTVVVVMALRSRFRQAARHVVQALSLIVFFYIVFSCLGVFGLIRNAFHGVSLIGTVHTESFFWMSLPVCVLAFTIISGPFFCGWICPTGTIQEWVALLREWLARRATSSPWRAGPLGFSLLALATAGFLYLLFSVSEERKLFVEDSSLYWAAASLLLPLLVMSKLASDSAIRSLRWGSLGLIGGGAVFKVAITSPMHFAFVDVADPASAVTTLVLAVASVFVARAWCRYLCPFGLVLGLLHRYSRQRVVIDPGSCTQCMRCANTCKVEAIRKSAGGPLEIALDQCQFCHACVDVCSRSAAQIVDCWARPNTVSAERG